MQVQSYLFFNGRCEEAIEFYKKTLGAKVEMMMRFSESPEKSSMPVQPNPNKIMHSCFKIGDTAIMASDGCSEGTPEFKGFSLSINAKDEAEATPPVRGAVGRRPGASAADQDVLLARLRHGRRTSSAWAGWSIVEQAAAKAA